MRDQVRNPQVSRLSAAASTRVDTEADESARDIPKGGLAHGEHPSFTCPAYPGSGPTTTGLAGFDDHSDQEPTYSSAGMPATASASTSCAPETPEPQ